MCGALTLVVALLYFGSSGSLHARISGLPWRQTTGQRQDCIQQPDRTLNSRPSPGRARRNTASVERSSSTAGDGAKQRHPRSRTSCMKQIEITPELRRSSSMNSRGSRGQSGVDIETPRPALHAATSQPALHFLSFFRPGILFSFFTNDGD